MGLAKTKASAQERAEAEIKQAESGSQAAIDRLKGAGIGPVDEARKQAVPAYKPRDFDREAKGKVKCVMFEAALQSPAIAGLRFDTLEEYLILVEKAANAGVAYTWRD